MIEVGQSYEMVGNFKAFVMFCGEKIRSLAHLGRKILNMFMLVRKFFCTILVLVRKFFSTSPPHSSPVDNIFGKNLYDLDKILGNVGQNMTTPPPPNVDGFTTSLNICNICEQLYDRHGIVRALSGRLVPSLRIRARSFTG
jgi:hypothetical protein